MILVSENINVISKTMGKAFKERNVEPVADLARRLTDSGTDMLDINIGPARKDGTELMPWLVNTVQGVSPLHLSLDTTNADAMQAGLEVARKPALINSVSLQPERLERLLPMVNRYEANMIGLLWGVEGMPRDANERCMLAVDMVYKAGEAGITPDRIWIDPISTPVTVDIVQVQACLEFMSMLGEIAPEARSIVGLSNISNGVPAHLRGYFNRTSLITFMKYGLHAAICDTFDEELVKIARGQMPELVNLVHRMMDGEDPDPSKLNQKEMEYYKTYRVISGKVLYSDSWLEI